MYCYIDIKYQQPSTKQASPFTLHRFVALFQIISYHFIYLDILLRKYDVILLAGLGC